MENERTELNTDLGFVHRFVPAEKPGRAPLLLLHGAGGNETDMLSLGKYVAPGAALLSPRGKVSEGGLRRFSRRTTAGNLDSEDLRACAHEVADFVIAARKAYDLPAPAGVAFSNGANVGAAMLLLRSDTLNGAVLMRPVLPPCSSKPCDLAGRPVLILSGMRDEVASPAQGEQLANLLKEAGATVTFEIIAAAHRITPQDLSVIRSWLDLHA
jgi:phospholipase/carboxylesterase